MDPKTFYSLKSYRLTLLVEQINDAKAQLAEIIADEKLAPGGDVNDLTYINHNLDVAQLSASGLRAAVEAML